MKSNRYRICQLKSSKFPDAFLAAIAEIFIARENGAVRQSFRSQSCVVALDSGN